MALIDPGGIVTRSVRLRSIRPSPLHVWHGVSTIVPCPTAARARRGGDHLAEHGLAHLRTSPEPLHCGHCCGLVPGSAPVPVQVAHRSNAVNSISFLAPAIELLERQPKVVAEIGAGLRPWSPRAGRSRRGAAEERVEEVAEALEVSPKPLPAPAPPLTPARPKRSYAWRRCGSDRIW